MFGKGLEKDFFIVSGKSGNPELCTEVAGLPVDFGDQHCSLSWKPGQEAKNIFKITYQECTVVKLALKLLNITVVCYMTVFSFC